MPALREYVDSQDRSPFARWLGSLGTPAALKVRTALARLEAGNTSAHKSVGGGVHEVRIDFGPGYRVYLGLAPNHGRVPQLPMRKNGGMTTGAESAAASRRPADAID